MIRVKTMAKTTISLFLCVACVYLLNWLFNKYSEGFFRQTEWWIVNGRSLVMSKYHDVTLRISFWTMIGASLVIAVYMVYYGLEVLIAFKATIAFSIVFMLSGFALLSFGINLAWFFLAYYFLLCIFLRITFSMLALGEQKDKRGIISFFKNLANSFSIASIDGKVVIVLRIIVIMVWTFTCVSMVVYFSNSDYLFDTVLHAVGYK